MTAQIIPYKIKVKEKKIKLIHFAEEESNCIVWWFFSGKTFLQQFLLHHNNPEVRISGAFAKMPFTVEIAVLI